jgi:type III restriction enzyme
VADVIIQNPILNSAFEEPTRHFAFSDEGITDEVIDSRRVSSYFMPIAAAKKRGKGQQLQFDTEWTKDRLEENRHINRIREKVAQWRKGGYAGTTRTTQRILEYWKNPERERKLFFCQIEALETAIYLAEVANKYGDQWMESMLREANASANPLLYRIAFKMATGSGKTVVMGMLIAWQALNKLANTQDARFSDTFLIVTPGITIKDRLRVLLPNVSENYYRERDLLPPDLMVELGKAKIMITNFHAMKLRDRGGLGRISKSILVQEGMPSPFTESPEEMVRRVCRELGTKKNIVVLNDEAHHCYRRKPDGENEVLKGDDRKEAEKRNEEARVWISGLEAVRAKIGLRAVYDLSATPFFLRGSGYSEGTLFPWVVSDFSLIDAIESGIVKVPRVPVSDDSVVGTLPTYRDIWVRIRDSLPKKGRNVHEASVEPVLPPELEGALQSLYTSYKAYFDRWRANADAEVKGLTPPVFIVVCQNTTISKLVFDFVAGWEKRLTEGEPVVVPGKLDLFSNVVDGQWLARANTILVDSEQLESGEGMSEEFKKLAAIEIAEFKQEYRIRFPGRDPDELTDEDFLREVMNTVGKRGKLGENVRCVVSVSMLTEGWDANTVTHILGVRAFGTQLLCEQVVGRGLRRVSYATNPEGRFEPEYAEVYGVPFSFIPCSGASADPKPGPIPTRVRALADRIACEITFPRVIGYRYELPPERIAARFTEDSEMALSTEDVAIRTENAPIVGETAIHSMDELKQVRLQSVDFEITKTLLDRYLTADDGQGGKAERPWLFPQALSIVRRWREECLVQKDGTFPQLLLMTTYKLEAAGKVYHAIVDATEGEKRLQPILRPYDPVGSTRWVDFDTTRPVYATRADRCHVSHVVADTESWEQKMAQTLEDMDEVASYVKNYQLGFEIPYMLDGVEHKYLPDFVVRLQDGATDLLNLLVEVTGERKRDKQVKVATARNLWVPAINNHGGFGRWAFIEITDPWDAKNTIRSTLRFPETAND